MTMIETDALTKTYNGRGGCRNITLRVREGSVFGLLGPNGAGKSTFVKMLAGLHRPEAGSGRMLGYPLGRAEGRRKLGYLPELFRFQDFLTAAEVLRFHARLAGVSGRELGTQEWRRRIEAKLADVGLADKGGQRVGRFSKGMQQRLGLACALLMDPRLVILDEPASALDPVGRYEIRELLRRLSADGVTVFLNTHLLEDVQELCDEVAFLYEGELLACGPLREMLQTEANWRFTVGGWLPDSLERLAAASPLLPALRVTEADEAGFAALTTHVTDREQAGWICAELVHGGLTLYESGPVADDLESWFIRSVKHQQRGAEA
ncbi:ABC transporter ATP-binding protein [Paenibacillus humicola]|uniref:ABC transporter ATP-binding protein n=1 Tax=Paenibacillus humicola TaxID=3110540 RepID=UPI00237B3CD3|nr:ABC transporter ATP-binding protein [Paenibacillus humicola]